MRCDRGGGVGHGVRFHLHRPMTCRRAPRLGCISCQIVGVRANSMKPALRHVDGGGSRRPMLRVRVIGACYGRECGGSVHFVGSAVEVLCGGSPAKKLGGRSPKDDGKSMI
jgi:hypothetical protein